MKRKHAKRSTGFRERYSVLDTGSRRCAATLKDWYPDRRRWSTQVAAVVAAGCRTLATSYARGMTIAHVPVVVIVTGLRRTERHRGEWVNAPGAQPVKAPGVANGEPGQSRSCSPCCSDRGKKCIVIVIGCHHVIVIVFAIVIVIVGSRTQGCLPVLALRGAIVIVTGLRRGNGPDARFAVELS